MVPSGASSTALLSSGNSLHFAAAHNCPAGVNVSLGAPAGFKLSGSFGIAPHSFPAVGEVNDIVDILNHVRHCL